MDETKKNKNLHLYIGEVLPCQVISFSEFVGVLAKNPKNVLRNVFQSFHDMIKNYVGEGVNEYLDDPDSIDYVDYDSTRLFVDGVNDPFFADRLLMNKLVNWSRDIKRGVQQNKIYIFIGPPGCGKSTFLNNLLFKQEEYSNSDDGLRFESIWRLDRNLLGGLAKNHNPFVAQIVQVLKGNFSEENEQVQGCNLSEHSDLEGNNIDFEDPFLNGGLIEVPCPSHCNPILMISKDRRREFFDDLLKNNEFKWQLFSEKEYEWVFKDMPCTICSSLFEALSDAVGGDVAKVFGMLYARPYRFNRRLSQGISVFNPGDEPLRQKVLTNHILQSRINRLLKDSNKVAYIFSQLAKTNNGIYALMDVKSHNTDRLIELHNIVSEGIHKVEDVEESVNSLLLTVMNPEDKKNIEEFQSFLDRIEYITIPYVLDIKTEVEIYRNIFGKHIEEVFLPRILHNFARITLSTRLSKESKALLEWLGKDAHKKYKLYCDENLKLLKMEIYTGYIPDWLKEDDRKKLTAKHRREIIQEADTEGNHGISGRDSITLFNAFWSIFIKNAKDSASGIEKEKKLINMSALKKFFTKKSMVGKIIGEDYKKLIPMDFIDSVIRMYDYTILQEVKESLYYYNEKQIEREILNYLFAINYDAGATETCNYTGDKIEITGKFLLGIESKLIGPKASVEKHKAFRKATRRTYTTKTLTHEIGMDDLLITETEIFEDLHARYVYNLKEKVLDPFLKNDNFRRAIKDYGKDNFKTYDKRIREKVEYMFKNLQEKYKYTEQGAKEMCVYMIDEDLAKKFASS